ncbi:proprotein convertase P-domain-containing protein [Geoalkalibacter sp.]|uniref:proprotein convertase P-domain-containing protein n=1 Tax=Geoalkalibacter sp. TaxID=3041440 RepID=UPI00272EB8AC|nr:proprotein convertase P-domain-containing protein [Geoalkalibacter sp.]
MKKSDEGRFLSRGGQKIQVDRAENSFTVSLREPRDAAHLRADKQVERVEMLTSKVAKVTLAAEKSAAQSRDRLMERLRQSEKLVVHHEYLDHGNPDISYQITPEILLRFKDDTPRRRMAEILEQVGVIIKKEYPDIGAAFLIEVTDAAGANPVKVANRLEAFAEVDYAEPSLINRFVQSSLPTDEQFAAQWHLYSKARTAPDIDSLADANVLEAWQFSKGRREIVVAVIDDGFELSHPDFQGTGKIVEPTDFAGGDDQPLPEAGDYHGTPCAGVAIAEENGLGCVGAAPGCAFMPVRFPLGASDPWLIEIFTYVSQRAHIASCSWGMIPGNHPLSTAVRDAFTHLARSGGKDGRGLVIVFAAGNYDAPLDATIDFPVRWLGRDLQGNWRTFTATGRIINGFPAHPDTLAVSAITSLNRKALYSNWGRQISVAAPSNNFDPTTLDKLPGRGITTTDNLYYGSSFSPGKRYTNSFGGTSSATPLVAGICALVKSVNPELSALEVKAIIEASADKVEDSSTDPLYGHAKGTYQNGHSEWFGHGKINALRAVQQAASRLVPRRVVEKENASVLAIPDFSALGVSSTLSVMENGPVTEVSVEIDITHTWIGDLEVSLVSPAGTRALLHNRAGGGTKNLRRSYTLVDTPALGVLLGESAAGDWVLHVADRARADVGTLNRWGLRLVLGEPQRVQVSTNQSLTIPDNDPTGIASPLAVADGRRLRDIAVSVDVTHTWIGDLRLSLVAPTGQEVVLHDRGGGSADNIRATYTPATTPALGGLAQAGAAVGGVWTLKVADLARRDLGKLNGWGLELQVQ